MKKTICALGFLLTVAPSVFAATDEENRRILKEAVVGAVTGAVAVEATNDQSSATVSAQASADVLEDKKSHKHKHKKNNFSEKKRHHHHKDKKEKKRPHGWNMGKKLGWGNKDVPPGLNEKDSSREKH